ncbi:MAG: hypothetical protein HYV90_04295 [Candidatus Woesebacteria bacterium]|nr:MAG: hypothetical protein HYV90_04295 [Candidatus Woesebacteria bacterium]
MERLRSEIIEEYFFDVPVWDAEGHICPAPPEAISKFEELKQNWMQTLPKLSQEVPSVALYPIYKGDKQGYVVATQIIYKPSSIPEED